MESMTDYTDPVAEFMWPMTDITEPTEPSTGTEPRVKVEESSQMPGDAQYDRDSRPADTETPEQKGVQSSVPTAMNASSDEQDQLNSSGDANHLSGSLEDQQPSSNSSVSPSCSSSPNQNNGPNGEDPIAYARYYGLCRDYEEERLLDTDLIPLPNYDQVEDADDFSGLGFDIAAVHQSFDERLDVDKDTANYLSAALSMGRHADAGDDYDAAIRLKQMKIEIPLLQTDHDADILRLRHKSCVKISFKGMTPFKLDAKKDEGSELPPQYAAAKAALDKDIRDAKLDLTGETIDYLKEIHGLLTQEGPNLADQAYQQKRVRM